MDCVAFGHISQVQSRTRGIGDASICADAWDTVGELFRSVVFGHDRIQLDPGPEPTCFGIDMVDCARRQHGGGRVHRACEDVTNRMRGDNLAIRHIGEMPIRSGIIRDTAGSDDGRTANREHNGDVVNKRTQHQRDTRLQPKCPGRIHFDD